MPITYPHHLYNEIVNSLKGNKADLSALSGLEDGTIGFAQDTGELGTYSTLTGWSWYVTSSVSSQAFQRNLSSNLSLSNGESLVTTEYMNAANYTISLIGDSNLRIL